MACGLTASKTISEHHEHQLLSIMSISLAWLLHKGDPAEGAVCISC